jgi:hypothetical protein
MRRILFALPGALVLAFGIAIGPAAIAQAQVCPAYPVSGYQFSSATCPKPADLNVNKPTVQGLLNDDYMNQNSVNDLYNQVNKLENEQLTGNFIGYAVGVVGIVAAIIMFVLWWPLRSERRIQVDTTKSASSGE